LGLHRQEGNTNKNKKFKTINVSKWAVSSQQPVRAINKEENKNKHKHKQTQNKRSSMFTIFIVLEEYRNKRNLYFLTPNIQG
jgi:hypothetical protein